MVRVVGVGDNTVDTYVHLGMMFPGGNAVNVSVLARRYGHEASYIGCLGDDGRGRLILDALREEGVDTSRCRVLEGPNSSCEVDLVEGDRVFVGSFTGVCDRLELTGDDLDFIAGHDLAHTSIYSHVERQLPDLREASHHLSFDFSSDWTREYLEENLPQVDLAFLSNPSQTLVESEALLRWARGLGPEMVIITCGGEGSMAHDGEKIWRQGIFEAQVVDTLGAGDAFAARFLVQYLSGSPVGEAMEEAARSAAETCGYYGAFGHGVPIGNDYVRSKSKREQ